uniref:Uncharacterized protein n=1 Tax=Arundo donax TaxID=35708 RepID=A0A0A9TFU8_ARUDO
MPCLQVKFQ